MRVTIIIILSLLSLQPNSQNLVPNPSFELINDTISGFTNTNYEFDSIVRFWKSPNSATPDLITPDFEEHYVIPSDPHKGANMIGMQTSPHRIEDRFWSECIGTRLLDTLIPNRTYLVDFWVRRADCINPKLNEDFTANEHFGILFSSDSIKTSNPDMLSYNLHISDHSNTIITNREWVKVSEYFTPKQSYRYLYLGQFRDEGDEDFVSKVVLNYVLIDDISVVEVGGLQDLSHDAYLPVGSIIPLKNIHFKFGSAELSGKGPHSIIDDLVAYLKANSSLKISINGHTDSIGSNKSNLRLSKKRARVIAKKIIRKGIDKDRIKWNGYGATKPIATNQTKKGRSQNRRVEFEVIE